MHGAKVKIHCQYYTITNSLPVLYYHSFITCIIPSQIHCQYYTVTILLPVLHHHNFTAIIIQSQL